MTAFNQNLIGRNLATTIQLTHREISRKVTVFALQLMRHDKELTLSDALTYAWDEIKRYGDQYRLIKFKKRSGEIVSRVVMAQPAYEFIAVKGTGRKLKPGQVWYCDAARLHTGTRNPSISTYRNLIVEQF